MSLEQELMRKSEDLLKKFRKGEVITPQEYRRLMWCVRLTPAMFKIITSDLQRRGIIEMKNGRGRTKLIKIR
jgi:hypothetical protein